MKNAKWLLLSIVMAFIGVPILTHVVAFVVGTFGALVAIVEDSINVPSRVSDVTTLLMFMLGGGAMFASGRLWAHENITEERAEWRDCLLLLPALLALLTWIILLQWAGLSFRNIGAIWQTITLLPWLGVNVISILSGWYWGIVVIPVGTQLCFMLGYSGSRLNLSTGNAGCCRRIMLVIIALLSSYAAYQAWQYSEKYPSNDSPRTISERINSGDFEPAENSKLTALQGEPELKLMHNWPRMDGATAALPLYASAFYGLSVLPADVQSWEYLQNSRTPEAWNNLIAGKTDIIFVAQPSAGQKQRAEASGVKLIYTAFAREAFVFITNNENPVQSLTEGQIRDIFSGQITRWSDVGGENKIIQPWQRPEDSGSQTIMLAKVMQGMPMARPTETEVATSMNGVINQVAEYQNTRGAIGYTFRYYATQMNDNKYIQLLAINGIAPSVENIHNGTYPYVADVYMVTRENPTPETQKLGNWFVSPQGQRLVQDVGYVPLYPVAE